VTRGAVPGFVPFALERWFASHQGTWTVDLSPSGAPPLTFDELLSLASEAERSELRGSSLGYGPNDGSEELRSLIAGRYASAGPGDVVVTCGATEALHLSVSALVSPGDEVIVQRPMYGAVQGMVRSLGARVVPWDLDETRGHRGDLAALERSITSDTRIVAVAQPNNPTGSVLEPVELDRLADLLGSAGVWLLSDEVYRDLALEPGVVAGSAVDRYDRAISIGDVAKPFGLGGLRVGWLVVRDTDVRRRIQERRDYTTLSVPTLSDALARIALRCSDELVTRPISRARQNLDALVTIVARDGALSLVAPRGGLNAFVGVDDAAALQRRLAAAGILVVPGDLFESAHHVRVWLGGPADRFALALEQMAGSD
jgi:aspartate/methionine/tyrosine aminotransferase